MTAVSRLAVVVGGTRGIGAATARALHARGHRVAVVARNAPEFESGMTGSDGPPADASVHLGDVGDPADVRRAAEEIRHRHGTIDILVYAAGSTHNALLIGMREAGFQEIVGRNLLGAHRWIAECTDAMTAQGWGRIVVVSSVAAVLGSRGQVNYAAAKAGQLGLVRALAAKLAPEGITVNAVLPGFTPTALTASIPPAMQQQLLADIPAGRFAEPSDIAAAIDFLVTEQAGYITGATIPIDGGRSMGF